jgi:hypothetical protein
VGTRTRRHPRTASGPPRARRAAAALLGTWTRPGLRLLVLCVEVSALVVLVAHPMFGVRRVDVTGIHHLTRDDVLQRTGLVRQGNVFLITPEHAETALRADPYVRTVSVRTSLPDRVEVSVEEWEPRALVHRAGHDYLLSAEGNVLGPAGGVTVGRDPGQPRVELSWAGPGALAAGSHVVSGRLLQDLQRIQEAFPTAYGLNVKALELAADQQLTIATREGPRILFGQMVTEEQVDSLEAKLASLKSLTGKLDLAHSNLEYVNLMNQNQPVTKTVPSPSPSPKATPSPKR